MNVKKGADMVLRKMRRDVILGRCDYNTPSTLAAEYLAALKAPLKKLVWFEKSGHMPFFEEPEFFHRQMITMDREARQFWLNPVNRGLSESQDIHER